MSVRDRCAVEIATVPRYASRPSCATSDASTPVPRPRTAVSSRPARAPAPPRRGDPWADRPPWAAEVRSLPRELTCPCPRTAPCCFDLLTSREERSLLRAARTTHPLESGERDRRLRQPARRAGLPRRDRARGSSRPQVEVPRTTSTSGTSSAGRVLVCGARTPPSRARRRRVALLAGQASRMRHRRRSDHRRPARSASRRRAPTVPDAPMRCATAPARGTDVRGRRPAIARPRGRGESPRRLADPLARPAGHGQDPRRPGARAAPGGTGARCTASPTPICCCGARRT